MHISVTVYILLAVTVVKVLSSGYCSIKGMRHGLIIRPVIAGCSGVCPHRANVV